MPFDLKLDASNQVIIKDNGDLEIFGGIEEMAQNIETELSTHQGTHVTDDEYGFPYLTLVFIKNPNDALISAVAKSLLLNRGDVISVSRMTSTFNQGTRKHSLSFGAETTEGALNARGLGI